MGVEAPRAHDWDTCVGLAGLRGAVHTTDERVNNLERWQTAQNGSLKEIRSLLNRLFLALLGSSCVVITGLLFLIVKG